MPGTINRFDPSDALLYNGETMRPLLTHAMGSPVEVFDNTGSKGAGARPHDHPWDEIFIVLDGHLEMTIGSDELVRVGPGTAVHVPAGTVHSFLNLDDVRYLSVTTQGNASQMFTELSTLEERNADLESRRDAARRHGLSPYTTSHPHLPA
jgi:quercetin dioxygenase-like cupin family protein